MKKLIFKALVLSLIAKPVWAIDSLYLFKATIESHRQSLSATIENRSAVDVLCERLELRIELYNDNMMESAGYSHLILDPVYVAAQSKVHLPVVENTSAGVQTNDPTYIGRVTTEGGHTCRPATYEEYCTIAGKGADELTTLKVLQRHFDLPACEIPVNQITELALRNKGLRSVKAISFMVKLVKLDLQGNESTSVEPLKNLVRLRRINLDLNPISDLLPLVDLPEIELIRARETKVKIPLVNNPFKKNPRIDLSGPAGNCSIKIQDEGVQRIVRCSR